MPLTRTRYRSPDHTGRILGGIVLTPWIVALVLHWARAVPIHEGAPNPIIDSGFGAGVRLPDGWEGAWIVGGCMLWVVAVAVGIHDGESPTRHRRNPQLAARHPDQPPFRTATERAPETR